MINKFLEIAGLLALLIGGVGIVNTMQVLLARRTTEIAMLKTTGYRRRDLALLFGLEAGLLGLAGGILGAAAAAGVSAIVHNLIQKIGLASAFSLDPHIIGGGVVIGGATALIFGLLPIVQAANVRPLNVLRNQEKHNAGGFVLTCVLLVVLSILFCLLATIILKNDLVLGIETTYSTLACLLVLSAFFGFVVLVVSALPIPERFQFTQVLFVLAGLLFSVPAFRILPIFGLGIVTVSLLGLVIGFLPRSWKVNLKMALRNLGRQRARTTTTLLALFIGIFGIGLVMALGQDLRTNISNSLTLDTPYNLVVTTSGQDTSTLRTHLHALSGLTSSRTDILSTVLPSAINGQALSQVLPTGDERQAAIGLLSQIESYDLAKKVSSLKMSQGRSLNMNDAATNNIMISDLLTNTGLFHMKLQIGSTLTLISNDGKTSKTATIVGILARKSNYLTLAQILAPVSLINALNPPTSAGTSPQVVSTQPKHVNMPGSTNTALSTVFYLKVTPTHMNA
ncbi:MAG: FtsX-like permease family protein, partial [Ktedonobacteraceae bacterium]